MRFFKRHLQGRFAFGGFGIGIGAIIQKELGNSALPVMSCRMQRGNIAGLPYIHFGPMLNKQFC